MVGFFLNKNIRSEKITTKEVAQICGVTDRTVSGNAQKAGVVLENLESTFEVGLTVMESVIG